MIIVTGYFQVARENRAPALVAARMLMSHSRREPGNNRYDFAEDIDVPGKFRFYEEWQSPLALAAHLRAGYRLQFRKAVASLGVLSADIKRVDSEAGAIHEPAMDTPEGQATWSPTAAQPQQG